MKELENIGNLFNELMDDADQIIEKYKKKDQMNKTERTYTVTWTTLDDSPITREQFDDYYDRMDAWREKYKGRLSSFEAGMSQPNPPNYFRANND